MLRQNFRNYLEVNIFVFCFLFSGFLLAVLRADSMLTPGDSWGEPYRILGIEPRLTAYKANALSMVVSLQLLELKYFLSQQIKISKIFFSIDRGLSFSLSVKTWLILVVGILVLWQLPAVPAFLLGLSRALQNMLHKTSGKVLDMLNRLLGAHILDPETLLYFFQVRSIRPRKTMAFDLHIQVLVEK